MKILLLNFLLALLFLTSCSYWETAPADSKKFVTYGFDNMDKDTVASFKKAFPDQAPGKVCGNIVDKKNVDCAVLISKANEHGANALFLDGKTKPILKFDPPLDILYLKLRPPGQITDYKGQIVESNFELSSVELIYDEKASSVLYWKDGKFNEVWTRD